MRIAQCRRKPYVFPFFPLVSKASADFLRTISRCNRRTKQPPSQPYPKLLLLWFGTEQRPVCRATDIGLLRLQCFCFPVAGCKCGVCRLPSFVTLVRGNCGLPLPVFILRGDHEVRRLRMITPPLVGFVVRCSFFDDVI